MHQEYSDTNMNRSLIATLLAFLLGGCQTTFYNTGTFLDARKHGYLLYEKDTDRLDGPYRIISQVTADRMVVDKAGVTNQLYLRGCISLGGSYDTAFRGSFTGYKEVYLLKSTMINLASNEMKAVAYRPATRVYIGGPQGFRNLNYTMPQLLHTVYGRCRVDHSDTNYPLYKVFREAEHIAKKKKLGYWETHTE